MVVRSNTAIEITFPVAPAEGPAGASPEDLAEVVPTGLGPHWPRLDADLHVPALLRGVLGSGSRTAAQMGAAGA